MRRMIWGIILAACVYVGSTVAEDTVFGGAQPKNPHFRRLKHGGEPFLSTPVVVACRRQSVGRRKFLYTVRRLMTDLRMRTI